MGTGKLANYFIVKVLVKKRVQRINERLGKREWRKDCRETS